MVSAIRSSSESAAVSPERALVNDLRQRVDELRAQLLTAENAPVRDETAISNLRGRVVAMDRELIQAMDTERAASEVRFTELQTEYRTSQNRGEQLQAEHQRLEAEHQQLQDRHRSSEQSRIVLQNLLAEEATISSGRLHQIHALQRPAQGSTEQPAECSTPPAPVQGGVIARITSAVSSVLQNPIYLAILGGIALLLLGLKHL